MEIINKFHQMELECKLFELGKEINFPVWDIVRYHVYIKYLYPKERMLELKTSKKHSIHDYINICLHIVPFFVELLSKRKDNIILSCSRFINSDGQYFDKPADALIKTLNKKGLIIESFSGNRLAYKYIYDFSNIISRLIKKTSLHSIYYKEILISLNNTFGKCLMSFDEFSNIIHVYECEYLFYNFIFKIKKPKRIFISRGNPKASILAANNNNASTYLLQHASIEIDQVDLSYPKKISRKDNILFPMYVLTFGTYWCKNINTPAKKIISIGNDFYFSKPKAKNENSILIISTIIHGKELSILTKKIAENRSDLKFIFKLHPNEYHKKYFYKKFFNNLKNVDIITSSIDTNELVAKSQLVILIISSVLYEVLNQNKKVAIYKKINFERNLKFIGYKNVYFFNDLDELNFILLQPTHYSNIKYNFFEPTNYERIKQLFSD